MLTHGALYPLDTNCTPIKFIDDKAPYKVVMILGVLDCLTVGVIANRILFNSLASALRAEHVGISVR